MFSSIFFVVVYFIAVLFLVSFITSLIPARARRTIALILVGAIGFAGFFLGCWSLADAIAEESDVIYVKGNIIAVSIEDDDLLVEVETEDGSIFGYYAEGRINTLDPIILKIWTPGMEVVDVTEYTNVILPRHLDVFENMPRCCAYQKTLHIEGISPRLHNLTVTFGY